jgi:ABC-type nitrate/sulfonate/bicarbonate transport system permease component
VKRITLERAEGAALLLALLASWQLLSVIAPSTGLPTPAKVVVAGQRLIASGDLPLALWTSLRRVLIGFAIAALVAIPAGLAMGYFRMVEQALDPIVQPLRAIAPIALVPLAIVWFGTGNEAAVFIVAYAAVFPILINTIAGTKGVRLQHIRAARVLGLSQVRILWAVILPSAFAQAFIGLRLGMGLAWAAIVAAELAVGARTGASGGIGQMMFVFFAYSVEPNSIIVCMAVVGICGFLMDHGLRALQRRFMPWA